MPLPEDFAFSQSALQDYADCARRFELRYVRDVRWPALETQSALAHETQTQKGRIERWKNMEGKFELKDTELIKNKHLMLVDDIVTTGATMEACGIELLKVENVKLSVATLCVASR